MNNARRRKKKPVTSTKRTAASASASTQETDALRWIVAAVALGMLTAGLI